jgi:hypothetical protein
MCRIAEILYRIGRILYTGAEILNRIGPFLYGYCQNLNDADEDQDRICRIPEGVCEKLVGCRSMQEAIWRFAGGGLRV